VSTAVKIIAQGTRIRVLSVVHYGPRSYWLNDLGFIASGNPSPDLYTGKVLYPVLMDVDFMLPKAKRVKEPKIWLWGDEFVTLPLWQQNVPSSWDQSL
jgi:hypothetical protein